MQIEILTDKGTPINLVRFFMLGEKQFLIYSDNSEGTDEQGHLTIHISEVRDNGHVVADTVSDLDWENIKNIIKGIVNANKNNQPLPIQDMDYNSIDGISIVGNKALKLMSNYVELLKGNQPLFEKNVVEDIIKPAVENNVFDNANVTSVNDFNANLNQSTDTVMTTENSLPEMNVNSVPSTTIFDTTNSMNTVNENSNFNVQFENQSDNQIDYKNLYEEQIEIVNRLQSEINDYRNKLEELKNIINN